MPRYIVEEKLIGTAYFTVDAASAAEAREMVRTGQVDMTDHKIDHTGRCRVRRAGAVDRDQ